MRIGNKNFHHGRKICISKHNQNRATLQTLNPCHEDNQPDLHRPVQKSSCLCSEWLTLYSLSVQALAPRFHGRPQLSPLHQPQRAGPSSSNKAGDGERFGLGPRAAYRAENQPRCPWLRCWGRNNQNERPQSRTDGRQVETGGGTG